MTVETQKKTIKELAKTAKEITQELIETHKEKDKLDRRQEGSFSRRRIPRAKRGVFAQPTQPPSHRS